MHLLKYYLERMHGNVSFSAYVAERLLVFFGSVNFYEGLFRMVNVKKMELTTRISFGTYHSQCNPAEVGAVARGTEPPTTFFKAVAAYRLQVQYRVSKE